VGYQYPHDFPGNFVKQQYLPDEIKDARFYHPTENGYEAQVRKRLNSLYGDYEK
jgi:putative ATPase